MIEELLNKPYWIVDILPEQAPPERGRQYRRFEEYWLQEPRRSARRRRFADILMKLSCYGGIRVCTPDESRVWEDPAPPQLVSLLTDQEPYVLILLEACGHWPRPKACSAGSRRRKPGLECRDITRRTPIRRKRHAYSGRKSPAVRPG